MNYRYTKEARKMLKSRILSDAKFLEHGAEIGTDGVLKIKGYQCKEIQNEMQKHFNFLKEQEEKMKQKIALEKAIKEATLDHEKRKIRKKLAEKIQDPRDIYREEIVKDLKLFLKFNNRYSQFSSRIHASLREFIALYLKLKYEAIKAGVEFIPDAFNILTQTISDSWHAKEPKLVNKNFCDEEFRPIMIDFLEIVIKDIADLSLEEQALRLLEYETLSEWGWEIFEYNPDDIEMIIDFYGKNNIKKRYIKEYQTDKNQYPVSLLKLNDQTYILYDTDQRGFTYNFLKYAKDDLISNKYDRYFRLIERGCNCDDRMPPLIEYLCAKILKKSADSEVLIMSGCGDRGCGIEGSFFYRASYKYCKKHIYGNGRTTVDYKFKEQIKFATGLQKTQ